MDFAKARIVDVSHWNAEEIERTHHALMDWDIAVQNNLVGVIVKYSQGIAGVDPAAFLHAHNAAKANVPLIGGYHFGDGSDPQKQAKHFLSLMKQDYAGDLKGRLLMLDAEQNKPQMSVRQAELFVQTIREDVGRWPWLYMGRFGPTGNGKGLPSAILSKCPLLLPAYGNHPDATIAKICPPGFKTCVATQFTDGRVNGGPFPGLGVVDQSRFVGIKDFETAKQIWGSSL